MIINKFFEKLFFIFLLLGLTGCANWAKNECFPIEKQDQLVKQNQSLTSKDSSTTFSLFLVPKYFCRFFKKQVSKKFIILFDSIMGYNTEKSFIPDYNRFCRSDDLIPQYFLAGSRMIFSPLYGAVISKTVNNITEGTLAFLANPNFRYKIINPDNTGRATNANPITIKMVEDLIWKTYRRIPDKFFVDFIIYVLASFTKLLNKQMPNGDLILSFLDKKSRHNSQQLGFHFSSWN